MDKIKELNIFFENYFEKQKDFSNSNDNIKSLLDIDIFLNQLKDKINNLFQSNIDYSLHQVIKDDVIVTNIIFKENNIENSILLSYKSIDLLKNIFQIISNLSNEKLEKYYKEYYEKDKNICLINSNCEYHQINLFENDNTFTITLYNSLA